MTKLYSTYNVLPNHGSFMNIKYTTVWS